MASKPTVPWPEIFGDWDRTQEKMIDGPVPEPWSGDGTVRTYDQCKEWADKFDCDLKIATDRQLFIDIDTEHQYQVFCHVFPIFKKHFDWSFKVKVTETPSKQGLPHRHIIIDLTSERSLLERIALQACLGSDPAREMLCIKRALNGEENVVIFFEKKGRPLK